MANMLEGGGKTPVLSPEELEQLGFRLVAYPLSLLGVSIRAMQSALQLLKVRSPLRSLSCSLRHPLRLDKAHAPSLQRNI